MSFLKLASQQKHVSDINTGLCLSCCLTSSTENITSPASREAQLRNPDATKLNLSAVVAVLGLRYCFWLTIELSANSCHAKLKIEISKIMTQEVYLISSVMS
jgi:hypothetical protein